MPNCLEKFQVSFQDQKIYQSEEHTSKYQNTNSSSLFTTTLKEFSVGHSAAKRNQRRLNDLNCTCWWCPSLQVLLALVQWGALPSSLAMSQGWFCDGRGGLTYSSRHLTIKSILDIVSTSSTVVSICLKWHYSVWHQHQQIVCPIKTLLAGMFKTSHLTKQEYSMTGRPSPLKVDTGAASETALHDFLTSAEEARRSLDGSVCKWDSHLWSCYDLSLVLWWFIMIYHWFWGGKPDSCWSSEARPWISSSSSPQWHWGSCPSPSLSVAYPAELKEDKVDDFYVNISGRHKSVGHCRTADLD